MEDRHIFFDLDHTLWDFEKNSKTALRHIFKATELDSKINEFSTFHRVYKNSNRILWRQYGRGKLTKEELRTKRFEDTLKYFKIENSALVEELSSSYLEISPFQKNLFPFALDTLTDLKKEKYNMHIITNGFKEVQHIKLRESGLTPFFDVIVCSEEVGVTKPDPKVFLHSMERAGAVPQKSVMIGDDYQVDYMGALNAGMKAVFFNHRGYHKVRKGDEVIHQLNELPERLSWIMRD